MTPGILSFGRNIELTSREKVSVNQGGGERKSHQIFSLFWGGGGGGEEAGTLGGSWNTRGEVGTLGGKLEY